MATNYIRLTIEDVKLKGMKKKNADNDKKRNYEDGEKH